MSNAQSIRKYTARLHERLYELKAEYTGVDPQSIIAPLLQTVFEHDPQMVLEEVKSLLLKVAALTKSLDKTVPQYQLRIPGESPKAYTAAELDRIKNALSQELHYYRDALESIENGLDLTATIEDPDRKIATKFSVDTLAYFFRLLVDEGLVVKLRPNTRLYEKIGSTFSTKEASNISPKSIKNKYTDPDQNTLDDMVTILQHLQTLARQYQQKGVKDTSKKKKK